MRPTYLIALLCAVLALAGCGRAAADDLRVEEGWVRLAAVSGRPAAAYFVLRGGGTAERLARIETPSATRAELHQGGMMEGMMTMRPMNGIDVPAGGRVAFAPGGDHIMLFGVDPNLKPGGTMPLRFRFQSGATRDASLRVVGAGDPAPSLTD